MVLAVQRKRINAIIGLLFCVDCHADGLLFDEIAAEIRCQNCCRTFKVVNGIPAFVPDELLSFSEISPSEREKFLEMKRVAYAGSGFVRRMYNHYHRFAAEKRIKPGEKRISVDVGCGIGEHYPFITEEEKANSSFIGIDLDRFKLEHFSMLHPEIPVLQADAVRLPFADKSVDTLQLLATLEHFSEREIVDLLDEFSRIVKPGGSLIVCYPAEGGLLLKFSQLLMHAYLKGRSGFDLDNGAVHRHLSGAAEIRAILGGRKELTRVETCYYPCGISSINLSLFVNELYRKR